MVMVNGNSTTSRTSGRSEAKWQGQGQGQGSSMGNAAKQPAIKSLCPGKYSCIEDYVMKYWVSKKTVPTFENSFHQEYFTDFNDSNSS